MFSFTDINMATVQIHEAIRTGNRYFCGTFYELFDNAVSNSDYTASNGRITNNTQVDVSHIQTLSHNFPGDNEEIHKKSRSGQPVSRSSTNLGPSEYETGMATTIP
jgi:hypothetical protein